MSNVDYTQFFTFGAEVGRKATYCIEISIGVHAFFSDHLMDYHLNVSIYQSELSKGRPSNPKRLAFIIVEFEVDLIICCDKFDDGFVDEASVYK